MIHHAVAPLAVLLVILTGLTTAGAPPAAASAGEPAIRRVAGDDRVATSIAVARATHPDGADVVVLARADAFPDAVTAAPLAASLDAPLLLTPGGGLRDDVDRTVRELGATRAVLLGGPDALAPEVAARLQTLGLGVRRLAGGSRFGTAAAVARMLDERPGGAHAYLARGQSRLPGGGWPDAVAVAGLAAARRRPVLLTARDALPRATRRTVEELAVETVTIVGGSAAVSPAVADELRALGISVDRLAGPTRYGTSAAIADATVRWRSGRSGRVWVATGRDWADALTAGPAAATTGGSLLLVDGREVGGAGTTERWLARHRDDVAELNVLGGERAITPRVRRALRLDLTDPARVSVDVSTTEVVEQVTGAASPNRTDARWGVHGTDLGHLFTHRGELRMVFGDTFGPGGFGGSDWRSNAMARLDDRDPRDGLTFASMVNDRPGHAGELLPSHKQPGVEVTVIPTNGVSVGGRIFLHYMSVREWQQPGRWDVRRSGLAYSDDDGRTWTVDSGVTWPDGSNFAQVAMLAHHGYVYLYGIPEGRQGGVHLARVPAERMLEHDAYEYWTGSTWLRGGEDEATTVVDGPVGELSVRYSPYLNRWLMTYLDVDRYAAVLRTSRRLVGPWDQPRVLTTGADVPQLYAPYLVPGVDTEPDLYYTLSRFDRYNVLLMRTRLDVSLD